jgi:hypothetical protein
MKKIFLCSVVVLCICSTLLLSCAKSEDTEKEKGAIDRMSEKAGKEMADRIADPLEKARIAKEQVDENYRDMEEDIRGE